MTARNASAEKKSKYFEKKPPHKPVEYESKYYADAKEQTHRLPDGSLKSSIDEEWERTH